MTTFAKKKIILFYSLFLTSEPGVGLTVHTLEGGGHTPGAGPHPGGEGGHTGQCGDQPLQGSGGQPVPGQLCFMISLMVSLMIMVMVTIMVRAR